MENKYLYLGLILGVNSLVPAAAISSQKCSVFGLFFGLKIAKILRNFKIVYTSRKRGFNQKEKEYVVPFSKKGTKKVKK